jgi:hypothetical protein
MRSIEINSKFGTFPIIDLGTKVFLIFLLFIYLSIFVGCRRIIGLPNRHTNRYVKPSDLYGNWRVKKDSMDNLIQDGYKKYITEEDHQIRLFEDSSCQICTYFYTFSNPTIEQQEQYYLHKTKGTWKISKKGTYIRHHLVQVPVVEIKVSQSRNSPEGGVAHTKTLDFFIAEENGNLVLWKYIGDPDYRKYMDFVREQ